LSFLAERLEWVSRRLKGAGKGRRPPREGRDMHAHRLIETASFGPEALKTVYQAFDEAWTVLAPRYGNDAPAIEAARTRLANILLGLAWEDSSDVGALKDAALRRYQEVAGDR